MEKNIVYSHFCEKSSIKLNKEEALRYMLCSKDNTSSVNFLEENIPEFTENVSYKGSYIFVPIEFFSDGVIVLGKKIFSKSLLKNLSGCEYAVIFTSTIGILIDRLIAKYVVKDIPKALAFDALASCAAEEYTDVLLNDISEKIKDENLFFHPRFSPGYGDFSINEQKFILDITNAGKLLGVTLSESLLMVPSKTVTAIVGLSKEKPPCENQKCEICENTNCKYRR